MNVVIGHVCYICQILNTYAYMGMYVYMYVTYEVSGINKATKSTVHIFDI